MARYFFETSQRAHQEITRLFDFAWPTQVALWNLRWQVQGFKQVRPDATAEMLLRRFSDGAGVHGVNLERACIETPWDKQQEAFARMLLFNLCAVFEGWIGHVLDQLSALTRDNEKDLQFPTRAQVVVNNLTQPESTTMKQCFFARLSKEPKYALANLDNLLTCYRYFKEVRNSLMHGGGMADNRTVDAYNDYRKIKHPADLGLRDCLKT